MIQPESNVTQIEPARVAALEAQNKDLQRQLYEARITALNHEMAHMATMSQWFSERHPRLMAEMAQAQAGLKELDNGKPNN